jgi:small-conductance mechanosensitive channel
MVSAEITGAAIREPLRIIVDGFVNVIPSIVAALLIILLGYLLGWFLGHVVRKVIDRTGVVKHVIKKLDLTREVGNWNFGELAALLVKWYVFVIFLNPAAQIVELPELAAFFSSVALWLPNVILAVLIALAGFVVAEYLQKKIQQVKNKKKSLLAASAKVLTIIFTVIIALRQIGVAVDIAETGFLIVLAGIMLGLALAFGFALRDDAKELIKDLRERL